MNMFYMMLGQIFQMAMTYPVWFWLVFVGSLILAVRLWGVIGAALMFCALSQLVYRLDVRIIGSIGADTSDLIFALGYFCRLGGLAVGAILLIVIPAVLWRKRKLGLRVSQALFHSDVFGTPNTALEPTATAPCVSTLI